MLEISLLILMWFGGASPDLQRHIERIPPPIVEDDKGNTCPKNTQCKPA